jgi:RND family efflux transporter MFP subunit
MITLRSRRDPRAAAASFRIPAALTFGLLVVAGAAALSGCGSRSGKAAASSREVQGATAEAVRRQVPLQVMATGALQAARTVQVSTRMMGWVRKIHVREGDVVDRGAPLLTIDDSDLKAKRAQVEAGITEARAVLANAEKMLQRFEKLYGEQSVSKQQLDDVRTGRDRAAAGLESALAMRDEVNVHLSYLDITAPAAGLVTRKMIEEGDMASPGLPLLTLEQAERMKVVASLSERGVNSVQPGDMVTVEVPSLTGALYTVPVDKVIPTANPGSHTYDIEAYLDNRDGRLKTGMFARVHVTVGEREAVLVPPESIVERGQLRGVFITDADGLAQLCWVRLGHRLEDGVEVLAGLQGGETVVVSSAVPLVEGDRVVR